MKDPILLPAYNLMDNEHIKSLFVWFGRDVSFKLLSKFWSMVEEYNEHGCQDCFRVRYIGFTWDVFLNEDEKISSIVKSSTVSRSEYEKLIGCCGQEDRFILIDDHLFEIGCNYGH